MLVLTRKPGETIVIADQIVIKFVSIQGKHLRIGIEAPNEVSIFRGEIYERIQNERKSQEQADKGTIEISDKTGSGDTRQEALASVTTPASEQTPNPPSPQKPDP